MTQENKSSSTSRTDGAKQPQQAFEAHHAHPHPHAHEKPPPVQHSHMYLAVADFVSGLFAGFACKVIEHPLDTIKVLLQTQKAGEYHGAMDCIRQVHLAHGFRGFYRGLLSPLVGSMAENAGLFLSYGICKRLASSATSIFFGDRGTAFLNAHPFVLHAIGGAGSGVFISGVLTPVELIKCQMQVQNHPNRVLLDTRSIIRQISSTSGLGGLYRGQKATIFREISGNAAWFSTYEFVRAALSNEAEDEIDMVTCLVAGASAGTMYWCVNFPFDTVKSLIQSEPLYEHESFSSVWRSVYARGGIPLFYRGLGVTICRAMPANAALFFVYELCARELFGI
eukprot:m.65072 g.65072  ORF g.65072 m.65072 type:complete len:338 (-) comp49765_c0_seq1:48-1061(-)